MASFLLLAPALLLALFPSTGASGKVGLSVTLTQRGLDYAIKNIIPEALKKAVDGLTVPADIPLNQSGIAVHLLNATVLPPAVHSLDVTPRSSPSSLQVTLSVDVFGSTHFTSYISSLSLADHGIIDFIVTTVDITLAIDLVPGKDGKWVLHLVNAQSSIGDITLVFVKVVHTIIIKIVRPVLVPLVKNQLQSILNSVFPQLITKANIMLAGALPVVNVQDGFGIDLSLQDRAVFRDRCFATLSLSGLATYDNRSYGEIIPIPPSKPACNGPMLSALISESTLKSLLLTASVPPNKFHYTANTGIGTDNPMLSIIFPEIAKHPLSGKMAASVSLGKGDLALGINHVSMPLTAELDLLANTSHSEKPITAVQLLVGVTVDADIVLVNLSKPVRGSIQTILLRNIHLEVDSVTAKNSAVGTVKTELLREMLRGAAIQHREDLEKMGNKGINIPTTPFGTPVLSMDIHPGFMQVSVDLRGPIDIPRLDEFFNHLMHHKAVDKVLQQVLHHDFLSKPFKAV